MSRETINNRRDTSISSHAASLREYEEEKKLDSVG